MLSLLCSSKFVISVLLFFGRRFCFSIVFSFSLNFLPHIAVLFNVASFLSLVLLRILDSVFAAQEAFTGHFRLYVWQYDCVGGMPESPVGFGIDQHAESRR
jgi:hypothetical protein